MRNKELKCVMKARVKWGEGLRGTNCVNDRKRKTWNPTTGKGEERQTKTAHTKNMKVETESKTVKERQVSEPRYRNTKLYIFPKDSKTYTKQGISQEGSGHTHGSSWKLIMHHLTFPSSIILANLHFKLSIAFALTIYGSLRLFIGRNILLLRL